MREATDGQPRRAAGAVDQVQPLLPRRFRRRLHTGCTSLYQLCEVMVVEFWARSLQHQVNVGRQISVFRLFDRGVAQRARIYKN